MTKLLPNIASVIHTMSMTHKSIPKKVRTSVWNRWIGADKGLVLCPLCNETEIQQMDGWDCSHVIPRCRGGETIIENLRVICKGCNSSMSINDMRDYCEYYPGSLVRLQLVDKAISITPQLTTNSEIQSVIRSTESLVTMSKSKRHNKIRQENSIITRFDAILAILEGWGYASEQIDQLREIVTMQIDLYQDLNSMIESAEIVGLIDHVVLEDIMMGADIAAEMSKLSKSDESRREQVTNQPRSTDILNLVHSNIDEQIISQGSPKSSSRSIHGLTKHEFMMPEHQEVRMNSSVEIDELSSQLRLLSTIRLSPVQSFSAEAEVTRSLRPSNPEILPTKPLRSFDPSNDEIRDYAAAFKPFIKNNPGMNPQDILRIFKGFINFMRFKHRDQPHLTSRDGINEFSIIGIEMFEDPELDFNQIYQVFFHEYH
jgi:hypothetical protein